MRQANYTGEIIIIPKDSELPYDRSVLYKYIPDSICKIILRYKEFLDEYDLNIKMNTNVEKINNQAKQIVLEDGSKIDYDKLLIASGSDVCKPNISRINMSHVFILKIFFDLENIIQKAKSIHIVIVGRGFIR